MRRLPDVRSRVGRYGLVALAALLLGGCATGAVEQLTGRAFDDGRALVGVRAQLNATDAQRAQAAARVDELLARPLSQDDALRIGLTHSPALQAALAETQAQQAAAIAAGRPANPILTFERLVRGEDKDIGRLLSFGLADLLSWPWRAQMADAQAEQARLAMVAAVVQASAAARQAWVQAVAAEQAARYYDDVRTAAEASAELARRMQGAGNFNVLQRAREQTFYADAVTQQARAQHAARAARERLVRTLGLDSAQAQRLMLPERLDDLPPTPRDEATLAQHAVNERLDLKMARAALDATTRAQGFGKLASWIGGVHLGIASNSETGQPRQRGFELELPLPLFDAGDARRAANDAQVLAALQRARQVSIDASSQLRESYHAYRSSYDIARHYRDEIVPLRKMVAEENLYRYNGMLIGVFELLADARAQVGSVISAIDAQRDFWLADAALQAALIGQPVAMNMPAANAAAGGGEGGH